ncbi:MAG: hypothetical protein KDA79_24390, partial [Planctomycetaceae bacterium]|nr:hypothetical protein [Planctomycetaceae bacterium]
MADPSAAYRSELASGLTTFVLPYLSDEELSQVKALLGRGFDPTKSPDDFYSVLPVEYYLAATVGMHEEVYAVTSSWADNRFSAGDDWTDHYQRPQDVVLGLGSAEAVAAEWRRLNLRMRTPQHVRSFLACTGLEALDCVAASVLAATNRDDASLLLREFARVRSPRAAEWMLQCKLSSKAPQVAREWLDRYVGNAVAGLMETAAGRGALADAAIQYLRDVKRRGHGELISACLEDHSGETAAKVRREVVDFEEKIYEPFAEDAVPTWLREGLDQAGELKRQKLPGWADPATLPPLVIGEHRLNDRQTLTVLNVLKATATAEGHPLLAALREHGNRAALDQFAWRLFEFWMEDGSPAKEKWAMLAIAFFGNDQSALKLTPLIRAWPGESQHQRAVLGLTCLRGIGSDTALMQLNGIAQKVKFQGIKKKAREFMESIAEEKGMTREELEDRVVPDLDLNEQGTRQFDFGPRSFQFVLSPDMKPAVRDEAGKVRKDLPKPGVNDDSSRAEAAIAEWKLLKKQLRDVIKIQVPRLEQSM